MANPNKGNRVQVGWLTGPSKGASVRRASDFVRWATVEGEPMTLGRKAVVSYKENSHTSSGFRTHTLVQHIGCTAAAMNHLATRNSNEPRTHFFEFYHTGDFSCVRHVGRSITVI